MFRGDEAGKEVAEGYLLALTLELVGFRFAALTYQISFHCFRILGPSVFLLSDVDFKIYNPILITSGRIHICSIRRIWTSSRDCSCATPACTCHAHPARLPRAPRPPTTRAPPTFPHSTPSVEQP
ncbi:hypothetical protein AXF42_Ash018315 [Apostasia shenzhenica]|uniref:Uncharacterized protein n=1 Tax=Apostasia shenzhenica TaxID=1088818 RepID=A0A2H9ZR36_9ASPA|nr:hypothetical protein AXF42_Ash018315 [Apostasia shenzhenica]